MTTTRRAFLEQSLALALGTAVAPSVWTSHRDYTLDETPIPHAIAVYQVVVQAGDRPARVSVRRQQSDYWLLQFSIAAGGTYHWRAYPGRELVIPRHDRLVLEASTPVQWGYAAVTQRTRIDKRIPIRHVWVAQGDVWTWMDAHWEAVTL